MLCPKCQANVPDAPECAKCGVIVAKYTALQARNAPQPPATGPIAVAPDIKTLEDERAGRPGFSLESLPLPRPTIPKNLKRALFVMLGIAIPIYVMMPAMAKKQAAGKAGATAAGREFVINLPNFLPVGTPPEDLYVDFPLEAPSVWFDGLAGVRESGVPLQEKMLPMVIIFYKGTCCGAYDDAMSRDEADTLSKVVKVRINADADDGKNLAEGTAFGVTEYPAAFVIAKPSAPPVKVAAGENFLADVRAHAGLAKTKGSGIHDYDVLARVALNGSARAAEAYYWAGILATAAWDQPKADQYFEASLALQESQDTRFRMIWASATFQRYEAALKKLEEFMQGDPNYQQGLAFVARAYIRQKINAKDYAAIRGDLAEACARGHKPACAYQ